MKPKILLFDIETTPHRAWVWGKYEQDVVGFDQYSHLLSFSAKWYGTNKHITQGLPNYSLYKRDKTSDKELVKEIWKAFDMADVVIAHNGNAFDIKRCNARFSFYWMKPPSPYKQIDTKLVAKRYFSFPSNSLNDIADYLGIGRKKETTGFPLWLACMAGDLSAWNVMKEYNANDVILLEKVYNYMLPYIQNHPNYGMYMSAEVCPNCGEHKLVKRGPALTLTGQYQQYQCKNCGKYSRSTQKLEKIKTLR